MGEEIDLSKEGFELSEEEKEEEKQKSSEELKEQPDEESEARKKSLRIGSVIVAGIVLLLIVGYAVPFLVAEEPTECSKPFCLSKKRKCVKGEYKSSYAGTERVYTIQRGIGECIVFVESKKASGEEEGGMKMKCVFDIVGGESQEVSDYSNCEGDLAEVLMD